jgi:calcineurin-like phosphoesterase
VDGVCIDIDEETGKALAIERIQKTVDLERALESE